MQRLCPSCKEDLGLSGDFFCLNCGFRLPDELTSGDARSSRLKLNPPSFTIKEEFIKLPISKSAVMGSAVIILLVGVLGIVGFSWYSKLSKIRNRNEQPTVVRNDHVVEFPGLDLKPTRFNKSALAGMIPPDADLYLEGVDIAQFVKVFFNLNPDEEVPFINIKVSELQAVSDDNFALFSREESTGSANYRSLGFVSTLKTERLPDSMMENLKEASWSVRILDGYVAASNNEDLLNDIATAKSKLSLNLSLSSKYAIAKNSLPVEGKLFILFTSDSPMKFIEEISAPNFFSDTFHKLKDRLIGEGKTSYVVN